MSFSNGHDNCAWMENGVNIPHDPTLPKELITTDAISSGSDWTKKNPWRSPGSTPFTASCGANGGKTGLELPATQLTTVSSPGSIELGYAINANHGGGWSIRMCPLSANATEVSGRNVFASSRTCLVD